MANKVLSIKMNERDIERVKSYYNSLIELGVITSKGMTWNGFLKHMLTDYLETDFRTMYETYSEVDALPNAINYDQVEEHRVQIHNVYDVDEQAFEIFRKYVKWVHQNRIDKMKETIGKLNDILEEEITMDEGELCCVKMSPDPVENRKYAFWCSAMDKKYDLQMECSEKEKMEQTIADVKISDLSEEEKQLLEKEIRKHDRKVSRIVSK